MNKLTRRMALLTAGSFALTGAVAGAQALPAGVYDLMNHAEARWWEAPSPRSGLPLNTPIEDSAGGLDAWRERFLGRPALLCLWATWCAPCLMELGSLAALYGRMADDAIEIVPLLSSDPDTTTDRAQATLHRVNAGSLPFLRDAAPGGAAFFSRMRISQRASGLRAGLPASVLVGPDGRELARTYAAVRRGPNGARETLWERPAMEDFLRLFANAWS